MIPHSRPFIDSRDIEVIAGALQERSISSYHYANLLQERLKEISQFENCLLFATGTLALRSALLTTGLTPGSGIAIPSFTCPDLITAVVAAGYHPVIVDCNCSGLLNAEKVLEAYDHKTVHGAIAVHQFGLLNMEMEHLTAVMPVVEDCCHVPPKAYLRGSRAVIGSFEGTKLLGAGEGGYLLLHELQVTDINNALLLGNRLSDLVAVLALKQLDRLDQNLERRSVLASEYAKHIAHYRIINTARAAWFRFLVRTDSQENVLKLIELSQEQGITLRRPIMPDPLHRLLGYSDKDFPFATSLWECLVSIPIYPDMTDTEKDRILRFFAETKL